MEVQVRTNNGALNFFKSVFDAFEYAKSDPEVWKISWREKHEGPRVRFIRHGSAWKFDPIILPKERER